MFLPYTNEGGWKIEVIVNTANQNLSNEERVCEAIFRAAENIN